MVLERAKTYEDDIPDLIDDDDDIVTPSKSFENKNIYATNNGFTGKI